MTQIRSSDKPAAAYGLQLCSHFQNLFAHYSFGSIIYFKEKTTKNQEGNVN